MPPALTPVLALDYVRELSADVRAVVVLDAAGELLAGPAQLAGPARTLLDAAGADELEAASGDGVVCAVRSASHAAVAVCGHFAIPAVVRADLRAALGAVEGRQPDRSASARPTGDAAAHAPIAAATDALISAAQRDFKP